MISVLDRFFDPLAFLIVVGGTAVGAFFSATWPDIRRAFSALALLWRARPVEDAEAADNAVRQIRRISEYKGIVCADRVKTPVEFVHRAACRLADAEGSGVFATWAREELQDRTARHDAAIGVWRQAADIAPAMGMIGTVIGLTGMFAQMDDAATMGPGMAVAMLTTLYGLIVAGCVAGPVAARLERLSRAERDWQMRVLERLEALARAEEDALREWQSRRVRHTA